ncbi:MAG: hypothetical protein ABJ056_08685 [Halioglobus sp.]
MSIRESLRDLCFGLMKLSLDSACKEQSLLEIRNRLQVIVPDLADQYTSVRHDEGYWLYNMRCLHSFQIAIAKHAISLFSKHNAKIPTIVDIGDSSGTHLRYLQDIYGKDNINMLSVNLDPVAVAKIRDKGLQAIESRAESLHEHPDFNDQANIALSFQMLEHLFDPVSFLHSMAKKSECDYFVITVPYLHRSRVGLHQVRGRGDLTQAFNAETTHIFELSPDDWDLIFRFSGWSIVKSIRYTQYPKKNPLSAMRFLWRKLHFDGYYGVILEKDDSVSKKYQDW